MHSHLDAADEECEGLKFLIRGNADADALAPLAASCHPDVGFFVALADILVTEAIEVCVLASKVLRLWPHAPRAQRLPCPPPGRPAPAHTARGRRIASHSWHFLAGRWRCRECLGDCADPRSPSAGRAGAAARVCPGRPAPLQTLRKGLGHRIKVIEVHDGPPVFWCSRCGFWAAKRAVNLQDPCDGHYTRACMGAFRRLKRGLHPDARCDKLVVGFAKARRGRRSFGYDLASAAAACATEALKLVDGFAG